jgi:hypothetical protein
MPVGEGPGACTYFNFQKICEFRTVSSASALLIIMPVLSGEVKNGPHRQPLLYLSELN